MLLESVKEAPFAPGQGPDEGTGVEELVDVEVDIVPLVAEAEVTMEAALVTRELEVVELDRMDDDDVLIAEETTIPAMRLLAPETGT